MVTSVAHVIHYRTPLRNVLNNLAPKVLNAKGRASTSFRDILADLVDAVCASLHSFFDPDGAAEQEKNRENLEKAIHDACCKSKDGENVYIELTNMQGETNTLLLRNHNGGIGLFLIVESNDGGLKLSQDEFIDTNPNMTLEEFRANCKSDQLEKYWNTGFNVETANANNLEVFQSICGLNDDTDNHILKILAHLVADDNEFNSFTLFDDETFRLVADLSGIRLIKKEDNVSQTLISFALLYPSQKKNTPFCELVMKLKKWDESKYRNFAKEILEVKFSQLLHKSITRLASTEDEYIKTQLIMMLDGINENKRDQLLPLLNRSFSQMTMVAPMGNQIQVTFNTGEMITFSNTPSTNGEYRGEELLFDLMTHFEDAEKDPKKAKVTLREWTLKRRDTDAEIMDLLRTICSQTIDHIFGLKTTGKLDSAAKEFLLSLNIEGIKQDTLKIYLTKLFEDQQNASQNTTQRDESNIESIKRLKAAVHRKALQGKSVSPEQTRRANDKYIRAQLITMLNSTDESKVDQSLRLLDRSFSQITTVIPVDTQIQVVFDKGEMIKFSNSPPTQGEYRGEALLSDLTKHVDDVRKANVTLQDWILSTRGTQYDANIIEKMHQHT